MASQGPLAPTAASGWVNSTNIFADDAAVATVTWAAFNSASLDADAFGFAIPGATIDGIIVELNDVLGIGFGEVNLQKGGVLAGTTKFITDAPGWASYGGATDLWGATWTSSEINDAGFGMFIKGVNDGGTGGAAEADAARITVYYTTMSGGVGRHDFSRFPKRKLRRDA